MGRRGLFRGSAALAAALGLPLSFAFRRTARAAGFGALVPDPDGILDLPEGFSYKVLEAKGDAMDDGYLVPGRPDAMGAFAGPGGTVILMRNHENSPGDLANGPYDVGQLPPPEAYDPLAMGGVSRVVVDGETFARVSSNLVLCGTTRNCAGGLSPWGWLSCEENMDDDHGYVFLCSTDAEAVAAPERIVAYGRCNHEAACVDPATNVAYLTEDRDDSCLYRFVPDAKGEPFVGQLQALKVVDENMYATTLMEIGELVDVAWIDIDEPDPEADTLRAEAQSKGAAIVVRGEGVWFHEGAVYVCSTSGGPIGAGQIFRLIDGDSPTLELIAHAEDKDVLEKPDNICVAPWGEVFIAEDGDGNNFIRGLTEDGEIFDFARNALSDSELCGVCFSPDGRALFVNIQNDGLTLVITGPFPEDMGETTTGGDETGG
ncbi:MAG: DUF839 domain-containing protein, partial [Myxococcales bacterium]|nr:DUF839 domain-containing protein [Myxococcales bacterium]